MTWKLKLDEEGKPVFQEEKPVYIDPDGKEIALDPPSMYVKIIDLGKENKTRREEADGLSTKLKLFEGIDDLEEWKKKADDSIVAVENFNDKDWMKAEKVEKLKSEMKSAYEEQESNLKRSFTAKEDDYKGTINKKDLQIRTLMVSNRFATSPFFSGTNPKTILPPDMAETYFGKYFRVEEDNNSGELSLVAYDKNNDPILSRQNPGEIAGFDEAMAVIWEAYPQKDALIRGGKKGSGAGGGQGDDEFGTDADLKKLEEQYAAAKEAGDGKQMVALKNRIFDLKQKKAAA
ncbi:MAG: hypothetical protein DRJ03_01305 [Chloroflexi bacterium]|nr:MAG: hypothetical protein DRJ03_01305 [Chloroflexota bacterium]